MACYRVISVAGHLIILSFFISLWGLIFISPLPWDLYFRLLLQLPDWRLQRKGHAVWVPLALPPWAYMYRGLLSRHVCRACYSEYLV